MSLDHEISAECEAIRQTLSIAENNAGEWVNQEFALEKLKAIHAQLTELAETLLDVGMIED